MTFYNDMRHITLLALPSSLLSSLSLPLEILNAAHELARLTNRRQAPLEVHVVSTEPGNIRSSGGLTIVADGRIEDIAHTDLLIMPSLWRNPQAVINQQHTLLPWLQHIARQDCRICAVGTSSYLLAEAGLLDDRAATTHWYYCDDFAQRYPRVALKRQHLITQADNIYCAGSVNSIADLMVHLIRQNYGQKISRQVEAQFSPEIRRPFEEHAYAESSSNPHQDEIIVEAQDWLRQHLNESINVAQLAMQLDLSQRSFNRRFKQATGTTANQYLQQQRLSNARELLRISNLSIQEVAAQSGYQDSSYFCDRFKKMMGQTPLAYRKSVRGKLFKAL
ncbi:MAG: transcriptional regulator GlxA family with amidase domain [Oceanicoccus sp.]|jgi:transcriptional regulator GlxA family with amidase domain